jgi:hypothetical protein
MDHGAIGQGAQRERGLRQLPPADLRVAFQVNGHARSPGFADQLHQPARHTGSRSSRESANSVQNPVSAGRQRPAAEQQQEQGRRHQAAAQVVEDLPPGSAVSVLGCALPDGPSTRGSSQPAICQSPRIQRWRRLISAAKLAGWSSMQFHVRHQRRPGIPAFHQVVTQDQVFRKPPGVACRNASTS